MRKLKISGVQTDLDFWDCFQGEGEGVGGEKIVFQPNEYNTILKNDTMLRMDGWMDG